jgi:kynureninase
LVVPLAEEHRGQFLTVRTPEAKAHCATLKARHVITDARDDRWRFGFGPYQDEGDVDALLGRLLA